MSESDDFRERYEAEEAGNQDVDRYFQGREAERAEAEVRLARIRRYSPVIARQLSLRRPSFEYEVVEYTMSYRQSDPHDLVLGDIEEGFVRQTLSTSEGWMVYCFPVTPETSREDSLSDYYRLGVLLRHDGEMVEFTWPCEQDSHVLPKTLDIPTDYFKRINNRYLMIFGEKIDDGLAELAVRHKIEEFLFKTN